MPARVGDWDKAINWAREVRKPSVGSTEDGEEEGREGCNRCSVSELWVSLGDLFWKKKKHKR